MNDNEKTQDGAEPSPASTGSVANDPLSVCCRHLAKSQHIIEEKNAEIARLRFTAEEREASITRLCGLLEDAEQNIDRLTITSAEREAMLFAAEMLCAWDDDEAAVLRGGIISRFLERAK